MKRFLTLLLVLVFLIPASAALAAVRVEKITLKEANSSLPIGKKITLTALVEPRNASAKNLIWRSSDERVAVVDRGRVTGRGVGTALITVSAPEAGGPSASLEITVVNPVTKIIPDETRLELQPDTVWELFWTVEPENATNKNIIWSSNNTNIATVDEQGIVYSHSTGFCTLTGSATDGSGVNTSIYLQVKYHDVVILEPGAVEVEFGTEEANVPTVITKDGKTATKTCLRKFKTQNGCVTSPEDRILMPMKAGSDSITLSYIERKKVVKTEKYTVFVSRAAVGEGKSIPTEEGAKEITFLGIPWGSAYPKVKEILESRGREIKQISERNDYLRATLGSGITFSNCTAFNAGLNFTYREYDRQYLERNQLFKADLYFDLELSFEALHQAVKNVYDLDDGDQDGDRCIWRQGNVLLELTRKAKFTVLEITREGDLGEPEEEKEEEEFTIVADNSGEGDQEDSGQEDETPTPPPEYEEDDDSDYGDDYDDNLN